VVGGVGIGVIGGVGVVGGVGIGVIGGVGVAGDVGVGVIGGIGSRDMKKSLYLLEPLHCHLLRNLMNW
jgi:hypothetical protein